MKRNKLSNRSIKFIQRNDISIPKVREYVKGLLNNIFEIYDYSFEEYSKNKFCLDILNYSLYIDENNVELRILYKGDLLKIFRGDSCWYQALKFIKGEIL